MTRRAAIRRTLERAGAAAGALLLFAVVLFTVAGSRWAKDLVAQELERALAREGLTATFRVRFEPPLNIVFEEVHVADAHLPGATFDAALVDIRPRLASLFTGKLQASSIRVEAPVIRVSAPSGAAGGSAESWTHVRELATGPWSFRTLTAHAGRVEILRDVHVAAEGVDLEAQAGHVGGEWKLRAKGGTFEESISGAPHGDVLCAFAASGDIGARSIAVERLEVAGVLEASSGSAACAAGEKESNSVQLTATGLTIDLDADRLPASVRGQVAVRAPLEFIDRVRPATSIRGWARVDFHGRFVRGWRLPEGQARAELHDVQVGKFVVAQAIDAKLRLEDEVVTVSTALVDTTSGPLRLSDVVFRPLVAGCPIRGRVEGGPLRFEELMRAVQVARHPHVAWEIDTLRWREVAGTLFPLHLGGDFAADTGSFAVFDGACDVERCARIWGFAQSQIAAHATLTADGIELEEVRATLNGGSARAARVVLGFHDQLRVDGGYALLDLARDSPLAGLDIAGSLRAEARVAGEMSDPTVVFQGEIGGFVLARDPFGDLTSVRGRYNGGRLTFADIHARKGGSAYDVPALGLSFGHSGRLEVEALVSTNDLNVRDLLSLGRLDRDPRLKSLDGSLRAAFARVRYEHGGPEDPQGRGTVLLQAHARLVRPNAFGVSFDEGDVDLGLRWRDPSAGLTGVDLDLRALALRDRSVPGRRRSPASIVASGRALDGVVEGLATAQSLPLDRIASFAGVRSPVDGFASGFVHATGSILAPELQADVEVSPLTAGGESYGPSALHLEAARGPQSLWGFAASGDLLGGQLRLDALTFDGHMFRGRVWIRDLAVPPFWGGAPATDTRGKLSRLHSTLSGELTIERFDPRHIASARASFALSALSLGVGDKTIQSRPTSAVVELVGDTVVIPPVELEISVPPARNGTAVVHGRISSLSTTARFDVALVVPPVDLALLVGVLPDLASASGTFSAELTLRGTPRAPVFDGRLQAHGERARMSWVPGELRDVDVDVTVNRTALRIRHASAVLGDGLVRVVGVSPIVRGVPEFADLVATARKVHLPIAEGIDATFDSTVHVHAELRRLFSGKPHAVAVDGSADVDEVVYTRPIIGPVDALALVELAGHARRHEAKPVFDPADDLVDFNIALRARGPLRVDESVARVSFAPRGDFRLLGTNRHPALLGRLISVPGGRIRLGPAAFDVSQAIVDFDDPTGIFPRIDVRADAVYRRLAAFEAPTTFASVSPGRGAQSWRIRLTALGSRGDIDLRLTSDPQLAESDIVLLLTLGVTRPELEAMQALVPFQASAGLSMLAGLGGAERLVQGVVPIDELRFGSVYSPETLTIIPDVTVGKRIGERLIATVSTSFSYGVPLDRIVGGTVSWSLGKDTWVEALWQNVAPVPVYPVGDFGLGVRWGHEFR